MDFRQASEKFRQLKALFRAGNLSEEQFKTELEALMVQDPDGDWWMIGYDTERWYRYDGSTWVQANPPGLSPAESLPAIPPPPRRVNSHPPGFSTANPASPPEPLSAETTGQAPTSALGRYNTKILLGAGIGSVLLLVAFLFNSFRGLSPASTPAPDLSSSADTAMQGQLVAATDSDNQIPLTGNSTPTAMTLVTQAPSPSPTAQPSPTAIAVPQQWNGSYSYTTGQRQNINFLIEKVNGTQFSGKMIWQSYGSWKGAMLKMNGEFITDFGDSHEQARWGNLEDYHSGDKSGTWLKWTETEIIKGSDYTVNGWYYAHIRKDGTMVAVYFFNKDSTIADNGSITLRLAP